ncbi:hypothetical protein STEG23_001637, partial [Scotinomys teguina]
GFIEPSVTMTANQHDALFRFWIAKKSCFYERVVLKLLFQKTTNNKKQFLRLPASKNSIQKVLKTETQGVNAMQVADALRSTSFLLKESQALQSVNNDTGSKYTLGTLLVNSFTSILGLERKYSCRVVFAKTYGRAVNERNDETWKVWDEKYDDVDTHTFGVLA